MHSPNIAVGMFKVSVFIRHSPVAFTPAPVAAIDAVLPPPPGLERHRETCTPHRPSGGALHASSVIVRPQGLRPPRLTNAMDTS